MTSPDQLSPAPVAETSHGRRYMAAGVAALALTGTLVATGNTPFSGDANAQAGDRTIEELCGDYTDAGVTTNASYHENAVLESFKIGSKQEAKGVIDAAFNENGPLAGKGDFISGATMQALIVELATDEAKATDPNYDYVAKFNETVAKYSADNGVDEARKDCVANKEVLSKTGQYVTDWANGEPVVAVKFLRDENYAITNMKLENYVATGKMEGIEFAYRDGAKDVNKSFASVLYEESTGMLYMKGVRIQSGKDTTEVEGLAGTDQKQEGTNQSDTDGGASSKNEGGPTGGTNGTAGETGVTTGTVPEKEDGPAGGTATGGGSTPEAAPDGESETPSGGTGPTTGTTPTGGGTPTGGTPTREPAPQPTREPQPEPQPTREPQPEPTREPQPEPTREPQPEPTGDKGEETPQGGDNCDPEFHDCATPASYGYVQGTTSVRVA